MSTLPTPIPETINALLPSLGYPDRRPTLHIYLEARETRVDGPRGEAWEFIFKCTETGLERRWGVVDRFTFKNTEDMGGN